MPKRDDQTKTLASANHLLARPLHRDAGERHGLLALAFHLEFNLFVLCCHAYWIWGLVFLASWFFECLVLCSLFDWLWKVSWSPPSRFTSSSPLLCCAGMLTGFWALVCLVSLLLGLLVVLLLVSLSVGVP